MKHPFLRTHALNAKCFSYVAQCTHIEKAMDEKDMRARGDGVTGIRIPSYPREYENLIFLESWPLNLI
jgi:hypothetical protein